MCNKLIDFISRMVWHASALNCMHTIHSPRHYVRAA